MNHAVFLQNNSQKWGYQIVEIPVPWYFDAGSRVHLARDARQMVLDILAIRRNHRLGLYDPPG